MGYVPKDSLLQIWVAHSCTRGFEQSFFRQVQHNLGAIIHQWFVRFRHKLHVNFCPIFNNYEVTREGGTVETVLRLV